MLSLNTRSFSRLKSGNLLLNPWTRVAPPALAKDPLTAIINFARYVGLKAIPGRTMEKLAKDQYFRYCFYALNVHGVYEGKIPETRAIKHDLIRLLKEPDSMTDGDLALGLGNYLNCFIAYMPGTKGLIAQLIDRSPITAKIRDTVLELLKEKGLAERATELRQATGDAERCEFMKMSLEIFQLMVSQKGYSPYILWR
ncbi:MAG: hypothetical protein WC529_05585 [Candidatus Margulisiibacteriota bacterium]